MLRDIGLDWHLAWMRMLTNDGGRREKGEEDSIGLPLSISLSAHLHESRHLSSPNLVPSSSLSAE